MVRLVDLLALPAVCLALPSQHQARDTVASDQLVGFDETVPSGAIGDVYLAYKPHLKVVNGCVPFPAVDENGNTNAGLNPSGSSSGECSSSTGQVYVRGTNNGTHAALMYAWYFPKDEPSTGIGHRHDWEGVIVWLSDSSASTAENILAVCPSAHGGWDCSTNGYSLDGTSPLIQYKSTWPLDHQNGLTSEVGGEQPLIAWESLPSAASEALENTDFAKANVPFKDANWERNLGLATF